MESGKLQKMTADEHQKTIDMNGHSEMIMTMHKKMMENRDDGNYTVTC